MLQHQYAVILLAAGSSSRLGTPKQLLKWKGQSLLSRQIDLAQSLNNQIMVVLGANSKLMVPVVEQTIARWTFNEHWAMGMSTSLKCGLKQAVQCFPQIKGVLVLLVDQPLITLHHLNRLLSKVAAPDQTVVATGYSQHAGVPAYLPQALFPAVQEISGDQGARNLFKQVAGQLILVPCPQAAIDIDTEEDWQRFLKESS